ncbi:TPA: GPO family capsid scaffolding protein [Pseudomonas aeruginosa]|uniref:GPO family capsid scaffolding protein n=1 Tax=Pseudomonas aeruginosa TaxID=287 RepID=UPI0004229A4E|nr:GPO family capsid scaffolding protein [Pseudomonas aeruginosa]MDK9822427.1 GPO family capsid scaffolding protein [Pseudomonas aeruginosa]MDK9828455.1 GPO family capsid scaffolding protein [Pseudomonas aeruginosa]PQL99153.1 phage capsid protein [Pseudomonas aeruginosa]CAB5597838.1 Phage capsid scaffolding protein (GPO) serine peptidase [Pseudomonas aeruginosa]CAC9172058.1 Phage capsid scaffolding protein (GPO) serine peptidase [Pseudomonas aeruginosa]
MASTAPAKKFRSKWTRIAVEGATTDGRKIERTWIEQMAAQYSPNTYGARINCEHIKWAWPGGEFGAYGDVVALKAEEVEINGDKKLALLAQLEPNDALLALNKAGQKIYTSIEVQPEFADTGKAYLVGLAITDTPASLGTEALSFSAQHGTLASRKKAKDNLFTAAEEVVIEFEEVTEPENKALGLFNRVMEALGKSKDKSVKDDAQFSELSQAVEALANHAMEQGEAFATERTALSTLKTAHEKLAGEFADLVKRLGETEDHSQHQRPPVKGGDGKVLTQF